MPAGAIDETMEVGGVHKFRLEVINERTEALVNISQWEALWCTVKLAKTDADDDAILQLTLGDGVAMIDGANGLLEVTIPDDAFDDYQGVTTRFYIDVKGRDASDLHWVLGLGNLHTLGNVTQAV